MFLQGTCLKLHVDAWAQVGDGSFPLAGEAAVRMLSIQEAYLLCRQMGCDGAVGGLGRVRGCWRQLPEALIRDRFLTILERLRLSEGSAGSLLALPAPPHLPRLTGALGCAGGQHQAPFYGEDRFL